MLSGEVSVVDETTVEITELPVRTWTQNYKETVLEPMLGTDKNTPLIQSVRTEPNGRSRNALLHSFDKSAAFGENATDFEAVSFSHGLGAYSCNEGA